MRLYSFASVAIAFLMAMSANHASAGYFTTNGSLEFADGSSSGNSSNVNAPGAPPLTGIRELGLAGGSRAYTNQVSGVPFVNGVIRTIGVIGIDQSINGITRPPVFPDGTRAHIIFAVEGTITGPGTAFHTGGSFWIAGEGATILDPLDPGTWNFGSAVAKYDLAPPGDIIDGAALGISATFPTTGIPASSVGVQNIEGLGGNTTGSGVFVFLEDPDFSPAFDIFGTGSQNGPDFLFDVEAPSVPVAASIAAEGFVAITDQSTLNAPNDFDSFDGVFDTIFGSAFNVTGPFSQGGYTPTVSTSGDIFTDFGSELAVVATVVPEPGSLAIFAIGLFGAGATGFARRRRRSVKC